MYHSLCKCFHVVDLDLKANSLVQSGLRLNTTRTYNSAQQSYITFCSQFDLIALPTSECALLRNIAHISI